MKVRRRSTPNETVSTSRVSAHSRGQMGLDVKQLAPLFYGRRPKGTKTAARLAAAQEEAFGRLLADLDSRLDEIEKRTDRLIARQA